MLRASSPIAGLGVMRVELSELGGDRFELKLSRGVLCVGTVHLPEGEYRDFAWLSLSKMDSSGLFAQVGLEITDRAAPFEVIGLSPGRYHSVIRFPDGSSLSLVFELPEGGDGAIQLRPQAESPDAQAAGAPVVDFSDE